MTAALALPVAAQDLAGSDGPVAVEDDAPKAANAIEAQPAPEPAAVSEAFAVCAKWAKGGSAFSIPEGAVIYMEGAAGGEGELMQPLSDVPASVVAYAEGEEYLLTDHTLNSAYVLGFSEDGSNAYAIVSQTLPVCAVAVTDTSDYMARADALTDRMTAGAWSEVANPAPAGEGNWRTMYRQPNPTADQPGRVIEATFEGPETPAEDGVQMTIMALAGVVEG